ncbi:MAG TPA: hypothetical protein PK671_08050, partial [Candidatus Obscuribacter sp.]|nr:hypothetical protein [Candidatus Obscuribacter sp.]
MNELRGALVLLQQAAYQRGGGEEGGEGYGDNGGYEGGNGGYEGGGGGYEGGFSSSNTGDDVVDAEFRASED